MYSLVMLAAMTAGPDVPQDLMCPVTQSKYGCGFWSSHSFYDCCAPAHYGWVNCWNKGFGYYPGNARSFAGGCGCEPTYGQFYSPSPCACATCGNGYGQGGGSGCSFCGCGWPIGNQPAYYTSVLGCPTCVSAAPYAYYTEHSPCCRNGNFAFDTGLIGHGSGVGYAGFGGYGNFGYYGAAPMMHAQTTADLPPFPRDRTPSLAPLGPTPMPPLPMGVTPPKTPELPPPPMVPPPGDLKKDEPKKERLQDNRPSPALVVLSVPEGAIVCVEGEMLKSTGRQRSFRTPNLMPGQEYSYSIRAVMIVAGREESEDIKVKVLAGETTRGSFERLFAKTEANNPSIVDAKPGR
jgi:uncharacterized protein (TIGR03000 family)